MTRPKRELPPEELAMLAIAEADGAVFYSRVAVPGEQHRMWRWSWNGVKTGDWYYQKSGAVRNFLEWRGII